MKHLGLFEGIGGFSLAARWMGWETVAWCEINPFCQKVLKHHFPEADPLTDIKQTNFKPYANRIDILTGGFPCQPYSTAGKRLGKEDDRHLWPEMLRAIREIKPVWVVGENVRGLISWNGGMVFDEVQADLENEGYEIIPFLLPACAVNAPHQRERVWFVAYSQSNGDRRRLCNVEKTYGSFGKPEKHGKNESEFRDTSAEPNVTNTNSTRLQINASQSGREYSTEIGWENFPTQSPIRKRNDGVSDRMVKYLTKELLNEISKTSQENRIENLQEVWSRISQKEIWEEIRRFYSLESKEILYETMQLYSTGKGTQIGISPFSENFSEPILRHLRKYKEFRCSPQGQKLQKQRSGELANTLSQLPHEVALAAGRFETAISKFDSWHRSESIKAYGNAIVPQVAYNIFKAIEQYELLNP